MSHVNLNKCLHVKFRGQDPPIVKGSGGKSDLDLVGEN